jgi:hypothetical protein
MNIYTTEFFGKCPTNNVRIKYELEIQTTDVIFVERILDFVDKMNNQYHENIADLLFEEFGGKQQLVAFHHGVFIKTERS